MAYDFDLFVIGAGSGGVRAARFAAGYGARVAVAESRYLGGTCVNVGCVPKKLLVYGAHFAEDIDQAQGYGWTVDGATFDWKTLISNKDKEIQRLNGIYKNLLVDSGVTLMQSHARLVDGHMVEVEGRHYSAEHILIATGGWPFVPEIPGREHAITSNEAFHLERLPKRALVVGGGYIAVEFASIFDGLGVHTTLAYRGRRLLRGFDAELGERLGEEMTAKGVKIHYGAEPKSLARRADGAIDVEYADGSKQQVDLALFATGRRPNSANLGLEAAGVKLAGDGAVVVNEYSRSSVDSIHAIGDVTNRINLTPVATAEAMWLARTLFRDEPAAVDHRFVPTAVFANPNLAAVGLSEERARERYGDVDVYKSSFRGLKLTLTEKKERTFMKLVVERAGQRVVGAHMIGPEAGEIIQGVAIAVKLGATKAQFDATIGIHPTAAEEFVTLREKAAG